MPIESGSHFNIPRSERLCKLCANNKLGDEFHYTLVCPIFKQQRELHVKRYFYCKPSTLKLAELFNCKGTELLRLCKFIVIILDQIK